MVEVQGQRRLDPFHQLVAQTVLVVLLVPSLSPLSSFHSNQYIVRFNIQSPNYIQQDFITKVRNPR